jgi:myosin heavy subunit
LSDFVTTGGAQEEVEDLYRVVSAILQLGNVRVKDDGTAQRPCTLDLQQRDRVLSLFGITRDMPAPKVEGQTQSMSGK